jgi:hypothetical protein
MFHTVRTATPEIGHEVSGRNDRTPVVLPNGWSSDPHDRDRVVPALAPEGCRVLVAARLYPTQFLHRDTPRSGQRAALGADLRDFPDAPSFQAKAHRLTRLRNRGPSKSAGP